MIFKESDIVVEVYDRHPTLTGVSHIKWRVKCTYTPTGESASITNEFSKTKLAAKATCIKLIKSRLYAKNKQS